MGSKSCFSLHEVSCEVPVSVAISQSRTPRCRQVPTVTQDTKPRHVTTEHGDMQQPPPQGPEMQERRWQQAHRYQAAPSGMREGRCRGQEGAHPRPGQQEASWRGGVMEDGQNQQGIRRKGSVHHTCGGEYMTHVKDMSFRKLTLLSLGVHWRQEWGSSSQQVGTCLQQRVAVG